MFFYGHWWPGLALLIVRGLVDHIDGYKARNFNQRSTFGAVMDDVCDRWVLGIMYAGGCLNLANDYPHILIVLGFGITGSLTNVIIKLSIYAESQQDIWREKGKIGHPVDVVGLFGSAEFLIYYGVRRVLHRAAPRPAPAARRLLGRRDHEPRVAAPARAVRVEALPVRRSGPRSTERRQGRGGGDGNGVPPATARGLAVEPGERGHRIAVSDPAAVLLGRRARRASVATLFILICGLLDKLDGLAAKVFNCRSAFGELFDAIADAICYGFAPRARRRLRLGAVDRGRSRSSPLGAREHRRCACVYVKRLGRAANYKSYAMERVVAYTGVPDRVRDRRHGGGVLLLAVRAGDGDRPRLHDAKRMLVDPVPGPR